MIRNLFAGSGGWCEGLRLAGNIASTYGYDNSPDACATALAAGHPRALIDLTAYKPDAEVGEVDGIIASPTCRPWAVSNTSRQGLDDPRGRLINVPLRWVLAMRPRWTAWEITPLALPIFEQHAVVMRAAGYSVATGILRAELYGVPSTRKRAVLVGRLDGDARLPAPTCVVPVSMAQALCWDGAVLVSNYGHNGDPRRRGRRTMSQPAFTVTGKCGRNRWEWPDGSSRRLTIEEAAQLQGFRADYPWMGGSISQQQQVGDTMPPPLAAAILRPLLALPDTGRVAA